MANHAKVCTGKTLNPDEINQIVQRINKEKFGGVFTLTYDVDFPNGWGKYQWLLKYKDDDYLAMQFWLTDDEEWGTEKDGKFIEYDEPKILSEQSCIEFRHGHSFRFMWWVEGVFRENLGKHYNAKMWDDGVGECGKAEPEKYETFKHYVVRDETNEENIKECKEHYLGYQKETIPVELIKALDLDFKI